MKRVAWLTLSLISLSACTVGPDFQRPQNAQVTQWSAPQGRQADSRAVSDPLQERWWDVFHDAQLSALTRRALTDNLDLKLASSRLEQSRAVRQVTTLPSVTPRLMPRGLTSANATVARLERPVRREWPRGVQPMGFGFLRLLGAGFLGPGRNAKLKPPMPPCKSPKNDRRAVLLSVLAETAQDYIQLRGVQNTRAVTEQNLDVARHSLKLFATAPG